MSSLLSFDALAPLAGPEWLRRLRADAAGRAGATALPTEELEEWRYGRLGDIEFDRYHVLPEAHVDATPHAGLSDVVDRAATVVIRNGRVAGIDIAREEASRGLVVCGVDELDDGQGLPFEPPPVASQDPSTHAFVNAAVAAGQAVLVRLPAGLALERPVVLDIGVDVDGSATFPVVLIDAGENSEVRLVEFTHSADVDALVVPLTGVRAGRAARVRHESVQQLGPRVRQVGQWHATAADMATVAVAHAALGGAHARLRFDAALVGRGGHVGIDALYLGGDDQVHDLRTFVTHDAADTTSALAFKGAVDDRAHAVYTGLIRITPHGRGSNATQSNHIVKLSPDAWAESVPNLEIEHNDVRCSHASTVGPIDPEQRFYLETRGVPPSVAERLVVAGFFSGLLESVREPALRTTVADELSRRLGGVA